MIARFIVDDATRRANRARLAAIGEAILREVRQMRHETLQRNRLMLIGVTCFLALVLMFAWVFFGMPLPGRDS